MLKETQRTFILSIVFALLFLPHTPLFCARLEYEDTPNQPFCFATVTQASPHWLTVNKFFNERIQALYGDQTKALKKIAEGIDRTCLVLVKERCPLGLLLYKDNPTDEFAQYHVKKSLEIKTLALFDPDDPNLKGHGWGTKLVEKCFALAREKGALGCHLTVSESSGVLGFYKKQGFEEKLTFHNTLGATEYLLSHTDK
ncbi:MAG: GNAT family N-acetyltransferase [Holosporaceae bacterium]